VPQNDLEFIDELIPLSRGMYLIPTLL